MTSQQRYRKVIAIHKIQDLLSEFVNPTTPNSPQRLQFTGNHYLMEIQDVIDHVEIVEDKKHKKN